MEARASGELNRINEHAAGIDIGAERHYVAVPPGSTEHPVREFGVFTNDLYAIANWLRECGVETVAMESTGVYWIPLFEALEERGFKVKLVDARKVKNVSGRKSDVLDCQWIQQLESYGLLEPAYRPADEIVVLRSYVRQREMLVKSASPHIQHMQKALQQMNLRLDNVVSDITGATGMRIIKAIVSGERDAKKLALFRNINCHATEEEIARSLIGNYREEHLFSLKQAVELFEYYQEKIAECEAEIEKYIERLPHVTEEEPPKLPFKKRRDLMSFNVKDHTYKMLGVDLFRIPGLNAETVLRIVSEVGVDLSAFPSEKHFASWLGLSPNKRVSGGKVLSSKTKPSSNRAAAAFRQAAVSVQRTQSELGAFYRRKRSQKGPAAAATATAHKISRLYYSLVKNGTEYQDQGARAYEERERERIVMSLKKRATALGFELVAKAA
ncbi:MAG: IS110 family transposase [Blastocatellia bacterium]|nr:IS110 family transposase [Blastocatellia bacterium]